MDFRPPNEEELAVISSIKTRLAVAETAVSLPAYTDTSILRFYRGRHWDVERAYTSLIKHAEWRHENNVDSIAERTNTFEKELCSNKCVLDGFDQNGRPILRVTAKLHAKNNRSIEEIERLIIYSLEAVLKVAKKEEERFVLLFDLDDFGLACMDYDALKVLVNILQFNYPETLHVALVIDAPFVFWACWAVIKQFLDPVSAAKAVFINRAELSTYIVPVPEKKNQTAAAGVK